MNRIVRVTIASVICALPFISNAQLDVKPLSVNAKEVQHEISISQQTIKVMTANIAHGRGTNLSQLTTSKKATKQHLSLIANSIVEENIDVLALQEVDLPSWWSGQFDHAAYLHNLIPIKSYVVSHHVDAWWGKYGTALYSNFEINEAKNITFTPSFPTPNKGFTYVESSINFEDSAAPIDVILVSLHLDFSRASVRNKQIEELKQVVKNNTQPLIIMGDFNTDWRWHDSIIKTLENEYALTTYQPTSDNMATFGSKRLDWILVSQHFQIENYYNYRDDLSDHKFVIAELSYVKQ